MQVDVLVFQGPPQTLREDVVEEPAFAVHRDANTEAALPVGPEEGGELAALVQFMISGGPNLWMA